MHIEETQLINFILDSGLVSKSDIEAAKKESKTQGISIGKYLVSQGKITDDELRRIQAYVLGIPFVDLKGQKLNIEILSLIPEPIARNHNIIAYKKTAESLEVAMLDTADLSAIDFVKKKTRLKITQDLQTRSL